MAGFLIRIQIFKMISKIYVMTTRTQTVLRYQIWSTKQRPGISVYWTSYKSRYRNV